MIHHCANNRQITKTFKSTNSNIHNALARAEEGIQYPTGEPTCKKAVVRIQIPLLVVSTNNGDGFWVQCFQRKGTHNNLCEEGYKIFYVT